MRLAYVLRSVAGTGFVAFAATAAYMPSAFAGVHANAHAGAMSLLLAAVVAACSIKLVIPVTLFGFHAAIGAPLFLLLAAPYFVRLLLLDVGARRAPAPTPVKPAAPPAPYALPARVAVALAAAARARR